MRNKYGDQLGLDVYTFEVHDLGCSRPLLGIVKLGLVKIPHFVKRISKSEDSIKLVGH